VSGGGGEAGGDGNACEDWRVSHGLVQNFTLLKVRVRLSTTK
jgi:hypothetical protein